MCVFFFFPLAVFHNAVSTKCGFIQLLSMDVYFHGSHELSFHPSKYLLDIHKYIPLVLSFVVVNHMNNEE